MYSNHNQLLPSVQGVGSVLCALFKRPVQPQPTSRVMRIRGVQTTPTYLSQRDPRQRPILTFSFLTEDFHQISVYVPEWLGEKRSELFRKGHRLALVGVFNSIYRTFWIKDVWFDRQLK